MYYKNRQEAGRLLAKQLMGHYRYENTIVMCLTDGGVLVGNEIAQAIHAKLTMLLMKDIKLPGTQGAVVGAVDQAGGFTYND